MLVMGFQVAYGTESEIGIKKKEATNGGGLFFLIACSFSMICLPRFVGR